MPGQLIPFRELKLDETIFVWLGFGMHVLTNVFRQATNHGQHQFSEAGLRFFELIGPDGRHTANRSSSRLSSKLANKLSMAASTSAPCASAVFALAEDTSDVLAIDSSSRAFDDS